MHAGIRSLSLLGIPDKANRSIFHHVKRLIPGCRLLVVLLGLSLLPVSPGVGAIAGWADTPGEETPTPWQKGSLRFGGFLSDFDSEVRFGINGVPGLSINGEETLGLDSSLLVLRLDAMYRPGKSRRQQVDFTYASYRRDGTKTLATELDLGGEIIPVGARLDSQLDFDIIRGTYSYAILQDDRIRMAVGLGIYAIPLKYELGVEVTSGNQVIEGADVWLPLPAVALRTEFQLVDKLFFVWDADFMYLEISDYKGYLIDTTAGLEYRPWRYFGLGIAYGSMSVKVEAEKENSDYPGGDFFGEVDIRYRGLFMYGKLAF